MNEVDQIVRAARNEGALTTLGMLLLVADAGVPVTADLLREVKAGVEREAEAIGVLHAG